MEKFLWNSEVLFECQDYVRDSRFSICVESGFSSEDDKYVNPRFVIRVTNNLNQQNKNSSLVIDLGDFLQLFAFFKDKTSNKTCLSKLKQNVKVNVIFELHPDKKLDVEWAETTGNKFYFSIAPNKLRNLFGILTNIKDNYCMLLNNSMNATQQRILIDQYSSLESKMDKMIDILASINRNGMNNPHIPLFTDTVDNVAMNTPKMVLLSEELPIKNMESPMDIDPNPSFIDEGVPSYLSSIINKSDNISDIESTPPTFNLPDLNSIKLDGEEQFSTPTKFRESKSNLVNFPIEVSAINSFCEWNFDKFYFNIDAYTLSEDQTINPFIDLGFGASISSNDNFSYKYNEDVYNWFKYTLKNAYSYYLKHNKFPDITYTPLLILNPKSDAVVLADLLSLSSTINIFYHFTNKFENGNSNLSIDNKLKTVKYFVELILAMTMRNVTNQDDLKMILDISINSFNKSKENGFYTCLDEYYESFTKGLRLNLSSEKINNMTLRCAKHFMKDIEDIKNLNITHQDISIDESKDIESSTPKKRGRPKNQTTPSPASTDSKSVHINDDLEGSLKDIISKPSKSKTKEEIQDEQDIINLEAALFGIEE